MTPLNEELPYARPEPVAPLRSVPPPPEEADAEDFELETQEEACEGVQDGDEVATPATPTVLAGDPLLADFDMVVDAVAVAVAVVLEWVGFDDVEGAFEEGVIATVFGDVKVFPVETVPLLLPGVGAGFRALDPETINPTSSRCFFKCGGGRGGERAHARKGRGLCRDGRSEERDHL